MNLLESSEDILSWRKISDAWKKLLEVLTWLWMMPILSCSKRNLQRLHLKAIAKRRNCARFLTKLKTPLGSIPGCIHWMVTPSMKERTNFSSIWKTWLVLPNTYKRTLKRLVSTFIRWTNFSIPFQTTFISPKMPSMKSSRNVLLGSFVNFW